MREGRQGERNKDQDKKHLSSLSDWSNQLFWQKFHIASHGQMINSDISLSLMFLFLFVSFFVLFMSFLCLCWQGKGETGKDRSRRMEQTNIVAVSPTTVTFTTCCTRNKSRPWLIYSSDRLIEYNTSKVISLQKKWNPIHPAKLLT